MQNRPKILERTPYYKGLPKGPIQIDVDRLPDLLKFDAMLLEGIKPIIKTISTIAGCPIQANPSKHEVDFYKSIDCKFQIIHLVVNCYNFRNNGDFYSARPYSLHVAPFPKRGIPEIVDIDFLAQCDLGNPPFNDYVYQGFNPFSEGAYFAFLPPSLALPSNEYADMFGFLAGTYFLHDVLGPVEISSS